MRLTDLDPHWLVFEGRRVGFAFKSPTDPNWSQICMAESGIRTFSCDACKSKDQWHCEHSQLGLVEAAGLDPCKVQTARTDVAWSIEGGIANASFETLTVTPSIDGSAGGLWHGFVTNGEIR